ncbi:hypothetical protein [Cryomorpha ignava]|nr:hypothetical protein [Cryomorpha ignava]
MDYAYTLQGWLKGINSNSLNTERDMGLDGQYQSGNPNATFAKDVYGLSLGYFAGDYKPIDQANKWNTVSDRFEASVVGSQLDANRHNLYNGNIGSMVNTITDPTDRSAVSIGNAYVYDQLHRISEARSFDDLEASTNTWAAGTTYNGMYENTFGYDANGNIEKQLRKDESGKEIDSLSYKYDEGVHGRKRNRLYHVNDTVREIAFDDDIDDMGDFDGTSDNVATNNNYRYDELGQLIYDAQEEINYIDWRNDGKIRAILRAGSSAERDLTFTYDPSGNRLAKKVYSPSGTLIYSNYTDCISVIVQ